ncbi:uncharacterized protein LOC121802995 isoform X2 [Salvia splendens]|uniref:uncharacterized protein LOC121802995 isoform X2 n=1 Tax=Salvia splendens TaxID=180675 RepID=UPI001C253AD9|nr:uncharacterized protein LOC121802995 isoform X2 [Salvia splendens]
MALLCFVLDLRSLSPPVLRDLKQSLLQLANFYAISSPKVDCHVDGIQSNSKPLPDRIGLCYIARNIISCCDEDAANKCVLVEFILLEQTSSQLSDNSENVNQFVKQICSLTNCSFQTCVPGLQVLYGLGKRWFQELKDDKVVPLQAHFIFKTSLMSSLNQISCDLCASFNPRVDEFNHCQTCRCHGIPLDHSSVHQSNKFHSCPITNDNLGDLDINENTVRVGEQTILYMPSFYDRPKPKKVTSINFDVIQRTYLGSLDEGLIRGAAYFVTPTSHHSDESDISKLNSQLFQVVCRVLNSLDQGLVCSSTCNIETATETSFRFYYILLPSDKGLMLVRRLSASEEVLPMPLYSHLTSSSMFEEINASLLKVEVSDYNPFHHERGFHKKLNTLVKESLQFGAIPPKSKEEISTSELNAQNSDLHPSKPAAGNLVTGDESQDSDTRLGENRTGPSLAKEWEQLIVTELGSMHSPTCIANTKLDQPLVASSSSQNTRQLDEKTSRILERLENPKQLKRKAASPTISCSFSADICGPVKKPLIPYRATDSEDQGPVHTQPIKPNFQRLKRKK